MATSVSGPLRLVTDAPAMLVQVMVRAPRPRPHAGGMLVDFTTPASVVDGMVEFPCIPGPAVLSVMYAGAPQITVPLVVPDKDSATLEECIRAAMLADTSTLSELEDLARRVVEGVSQAEGAASAAAESAVAAEDDRREVASDREAVEGYRQEVTTAHGETLMAYDTAVGAAETAKAQATTATDRARAAAESAAAAGESEANAAASEQEATRQAEYARSEAGRATEEADRAASEAESSSVKAVAKKVDELLAGAPEAYDTLLEIAEALEAHEDAASAMIVQIAGKADAEHTHQISEVEGLQARLNDVADGSQIQYLNERIDDHTHAIADVEGLDAELEGKAATEHTHTIAQIEGLDAMIPKIEVVDALPESSDAATLYLVREV